jgi:hypothetical protein
MPPHSEKVYDFSAHAELLELLDEISGPSSDIVIEWPDAG